MPTATTIEFPITNLNEAYLIQLPVTLTAVESAALKRMFDCLDKPGLANTRIAFDFSQTEFIETTAIAVLLDILRFAKKEKIDLVFWSIHPQIQAQLSSINSELLSLIDQGTGFIPINSKPNKKFVQGIKPIIQSITARFPLNIFYSKRYNLSRIIIDDPQTKAAEDR